MSGNGNGNGNIYSREAFFAACKDRATIAVDLKGWGKINVRKLTLGQLRQFDNAADNYERAKMLILNSIVDGNAQPIFQSIEEVDQLEMPLFKLLSEAVAEVNALGTAGEAEVKN